MSGAYYLDAYHEPDRGLSAGEEERDVEEEYTCPLSQFHRRGGDRQTLIKHTPKEMIVNRDERCEGRLGAKLGGRAPDFLANE